MKKIIPVIIIILVAVATFYIYRSYQSPVNLTFNEERMKGNPKAKVTIVEYVDLQCPSCAYLQSLWVQVWRLVMLDVRFILRHYPLPSHPNAKEAAIYTEAANLQGKFWEMHDVILERQNEWSSLSPSAVRDKFNLYAEQIGLDLKKLTVDLKEKREQFLNKIESDIESGNQAGVRATPTLFINNEKVSIPRDPQSLFNLLKNYIDKSR